MLPDFASFASGTHIQIVHVGTQSVEGFEALNLLDQLRNTSLPTGIRFHPTIGNGRAEGKTK